MDYIKVRDVTLADVKQLVKIYAPYVEKTAVSFEYEVPSLEEFSDRVKKIRESYPYLVVLMNDDIVGYAYASSFHARAAYQWCAELTIYLKDNVHGKGLGKRLYKEMETRLKKQNVKNLYACIAYPNDKSIGFHEYMGFKTIGHFHQCGYKLNQWWDMVWMEKMIGEHDQSIKPFKKRD